MFTADPQKNHKTAREYFDEHLSHNEYYASGQVAQGRWIGTGTQRLNIKEGSIVTREAFVALCDNTNPDSGNALTPHNKTGRRIFFDFTCSPPKSVSIMAVVLNDTRIIEAHQAAARLGIKELEQFAAARVRKDGRQEDRTTGCLVGAEFTHTSSRALDPQLHTHFTLFNVTYDATEERWKALQTSGMFAAVHYATEVYRNELAHRLHALGYETRKTIKAFEIKNVPHALCERFSKRAKERDEAIARMEKKLGRKLTNNEISVAVHKSRAKKIKGIPTDEVRRNHLDQLSPDELTALRAVVASADGTRKVKPSIFSTDVINLAVDHVFERASVVTQELLLEHALIEGRGHIDLANLKHTLEQDREFVRVGRDISLRSILEAELALVHTVNAGKDALGPIHSGFTPSSNLGPDQREALRHLLHSPDRFTGMRGLAGTGKTTTLNELSLACREAGGEPLFCAPTGSAADLLRKDGLPAITLQRLLVDTELQASIARQVIVLDEAGAVGLADMQRLFTLATEHNARVILSGDTGQHAAVAQGDALRLLEEHSRYSFAELNRIRRQQDEAYRAAVELAARQQPEEALARLDALGAAIEHPADDASTLQREAAAAYVETIEEGRSALLVAPTWNEIDTLTDHVRNALKARKIIGQRETHINVVDSLSWTNAQKRNVSNYQPGQVLVFHQRHGAFAKQEAVTVIESSGRTLRVQRADGCSVSVRLGEGMTQRMDVCEQRELAVAPGDRLLLQANDARHALINGQIVGVRSIEGNTITLTDGRTLPKDYRQFTHGYAITSHASQGKTVDDVFLVASSRSFAAINRQQFYVSISRGRQRCRIFTDDKDLLRDRLKKSAHRTAALELAQLTPLAEAMKKEGFDVKPLMSPEQEPVAAKASPEARTTRTIPPLRTMRYGHRFTRTLQVQIAHIVQRFRTWISRTPAQAKQVSTRQRPHISP